MKEQKFLKVTDTESIAKLQSQGWVIVNMSSDSNNTYVILEKEVMDRRPPMPQVPQPPQSAEVPSPYKAPSISSKYGNELARISKMMVTIKLTAPNAEEHYRNNLDKLHQYLSDGYTLDIAEAIDDVLRFRLSKRMEKTYVKKKKSDRKK